jgi:hypothetical protein
MNTTLLHHHQQSQQQQQPTKQTVDLALLRDLDINCMTQDYYVWTLSSEERKRLRNVKSKMVHLLQSIPDVSVAETSDHGSLAKNTFSPLNSDFDIIVSINGHANVGKLN